MTSAATTSAPARPITVRRVVAGIVLAVVGIGCVLNAWTFYALVLTIGLISLYELSHLCDIKGQPLEYPVAMLGVVAYIGLAVFQGSHKWEGVLLAAIVIAAFWMGMHGEQKGYFARTAYTLLAVMYIGKLLTYFIFIRQVPHMGLLWTLYVVVLIASTDILAMLVGSLIGKRPLTVLSPKKTVEGSVGALALVSIIGMALGMTPFLHLFWWQGAAIGAGTCIAAQAGDLVESALKRDAGVKDTGTVIQGHGGVLDRFDSYLFGGMAFFALLHVLGLVVAE